MNLTDSQIEIPLNDKNLENWIFGNLNFMGYFRVNYDEQNWLKIIDQLKLDHTAFTATERAALIYDGFTLARYIYLFHYSLQNSVKMNKKMNQIKGWFSGLYNRLRAIILLGQRG